MEECGVCQSLRTTTSTNDEDEPDTTVPPLNRNLFEQIRDELRRYALYLREKFREIVQRVQVHGQRFIARLNERFNWK